jgi:hypothetical protein
LPLAHPTTKTPRNHGFFPNATDLHAELALVSGLNHERYATEVVAGPHDKKSRKLPAKRVPKPRDAGQEALL